MDTLAFEKTSIRQDIKSREATSDMLTKLQVIGILAGLGGGTVAGISGSLFTLASWFVANEFTKHWLSTIGSSLLLLTIPLIILSGYCLDWEAKEKPRREFRFDDCDDTTMT